MQLKKKIINWLERKLTCQVQVEDIFSYDPKKGILYLNGEPMSEGQIKNLQEEIKFIEETHWWKIVCSTLPEKAREIAFQNSTSFEDMRTSKTMLKNLRLIKEMNVVVKSWKEKEMPNPLPTSPIQH